jgi:cell division protein FtsA
MQENNNLYLGLDIGTSKICAVLGEITQSNSIDIKSVATCSSQGLFKGDIIHYQKLKSSITQAIKKAEANSGLKTSAVLLNIPALGLEFTHNTGMLVSKSETGQITKSDQIECIKRSKNISIRSDKRLLHAIPLMYKVEDVIVQSPIGVFGRRLEVQSHLIFSKIGLLNGIHKILKELGFNIKGMMFCSHALAHVLMDEKERSQGCFLLDIGGSSSKISFIKHHRIQRTLITPIGGNIITKDIATCLNISFNEAERLKILYGSLSISSINPQETIEIMSIGDGRKKIKLLLLCQIIESRIKELTNHLKKQIPLISNPSYTVVIGGGGSLQHGLLAYLKKELNATTRENSLESKSLLGNTSYHTAIGMILYGIKANAIEYVHVHHPFLKRCKQWIKQLY